MTWLQNRPDDRSKPEARCHLNERYTGRISRAQLQGKPSFCPLDHPQRQNEVADAALEFVTLGTSWQVLLQDNGSAEVRFATKAPPICLAPNLRNGHTALPRGYRLPR